MSTTLTETHATGIQRAIQALNERTFYAAYPEHPKAYAEDGQAKAQAWFNALMGNPFMETLQTSNQEWVGDEISPYLDAPLGITYPTSDADTLVRNASTALDVWRYTHVDQRVTILMDAIDRISKRFFDIAIATQHTTGQAFMMSFQASGPHAMDRALETLALGYQELNRYPPTALWEKSMGKSSVSVNKKWKAISRGVSLVVGCSTFPVWNTVPGLFASLITGNPCIVKPHPGAILPIAIVVGEIQQALLAARLNPEIVQLAPDTNSIPISKALAEHKDVKVIDFTGGNSFGDYLEALPGKIVFTEKAGVNSVIIDSVYDLNATVQNLAFAACLYSGQMCTAPQNIFIPKDGIKTSDGGHISFDGFADALVDAIRGIATHPKMGPGVLGAIQSVNTTQRVVNAGSISGTQILLQAQAFQNEEFPVARTMSPLVLKVEAGEEDAYSHEYFGPIVMLVKTESTHQSLQLTSKLAREVGAISCGAYTISEDVKHEIEHAMEGAFTPVAFNLTGPIYMNQNAAFSDFHVSGGNPSGNATFTDSAYLVRRFVWVGHKDMTPLATT